MIDDGEISLTGGDSVFCINQLQLQRAYELAGRGEDRSPHIWSLIDNIEASLDHNERAALTFVLVDRLLNPRR
jgi:hypothetical protein